MSTLLITRPVGESTQLAESLTAMGHRCLIDPMLTLHPLPAARAELAALDASQFQGVVITSQHAMEAIHLPTTLLALPAYAVGMKSARAARKAGFLNVHAGVRGVDELASHIANQCNPRKGNLLYLRAQQVSQPMQPLLPEFNIKEIITYRAIASTELADATRAALLNQQLDAALFFSRQSAVSFQSAAGELPLKHITAICISPAVASALHATRWKQVLSAHHPTQSAIVSLIDTLPQDAPHD